VSSSRNPAPAVAEVSSVGGSRKWAILLAVGVGTFMGALDGSIVNTILPIVRQEFNAGITTIEWVVTIYLLTVGGLLLTFGRLGDLRGNKPVYLSGFGLFLLGSLLCGRAQSTSWLIGARAAQGLGAAMLAANSPAILTKGFPAQERGRALGIQSMMTYLGLTIGPSLGGWLAASFGWRSVFYVNVPVGLLALLLGAVFIPREPPPEVRERFDLPGAAFFSLGLIVLLYALSVGPAWGWGSTNTVLLFAGSAVLLGAFLWVERRAASPMVDLSLFRRRTFSVAAISAVLNYVALFGVVFLMPFYLIQGRGLSPAQAGLVMTAYPAVMALAAPVSGALSDRIGSRLLSSLGMGLMGVGLVLLARLQPDAAFLRVAISLAVVGVGTGIFISPNSSALMGSAPRDRQGIAAGILATARSTGMVIGVGVAGAIFASLTLGSAVSPPDPAWFQAITAAFLAMAGVAFAGCAIAALRQS
jgi:EmrB/QacA subfamily drug resistance transporter